MSLMHRNVAKQSVSNSFRGILRISPDESGQDVGFINGIETIVSDSVGTPSALSLSENSCHIKNLKASGNITLSGNTTITGDSFNLNGTELNLTEAQNGDILYYQDNKFSPQDLRSLISDIIKGDNVSMPGQIMIWASDKIPAGYLLCDGRVLNQSQYPELFKVIGHTFTDLEQDNTNIQFRLPDFRGVFPRGADKGRGIDEGRTLGSFQENASPNITGGFTVDDQIYNCTHIGCFRDITSREQGGRYYDATSTLDSREHGNNILHFNASYSSEVYKDNINEVRPSNIAVNFIIKY